MTPQFDKLVEAFLLNELMPADIGEIGFGGATKELKSGVPAGEPKGHWAPLQKLSPEDQEKVIEEILKEVFSEKENTYAPTVDDQEQLKDAIKGAIQKVSGRTGLKAAGNWAAKFLSDRLFTLLKGKVKYTTSGGEEVQKDMTQKDFKQALKKALEEAPKEEPSASEEAPEEKQDNEIETVYTKAADLNSDDADLQRAFNKLPDNKEMSWEEVLKSIGMTKGMALIDAGGLLETEKEKETSEEDEVKALDFDDEDDDVDLSKFDRLIDPYFRTTKGSYELPD